MSEPSTQRHLEEIAARYDPSNPDEEFDYRLKRLHKEVAGPWIRGDRVVELGCATGELTSLLAPLALEYHVVEGSKRNIEAARRRVPDVAFFHQLWEEYDPRVSYSDAILSNTLEHVLEPVPLLARVREWLDPGGRVHIVVPNADSLHRHVGVELGMLESVTDLSASDVQMGNHRVYSLGTLLADIRAARLEPIHWQGLFLKVLSNKQMLGWDLALIDALHAVGQRFPAHCAELYVVATPAR